MKRIDYLRSHLLPACTPMSEVPPDFAGLTYSEYLELQWLEYCEAKKAAPLTHPAVLPPVAEQLKLKAS